MFWFWIIFAIVVLFLVEIKVEFNSKTYLKKHISLLFKKQKGGSYGY